MFFVRNYYLISLKKIVLLFKSVPDVIIIDVLDIQVDVIGKPAKNLSMLDDLLDSSTIE